MYQLQQIGLRNVLREDVLATAQNTFFQTMTNYEIKSIDGQKKKSKERGFVNVESENIQITIENDTINMLRYILPQIIVTGDQYKKKEKTIQGVKSLIYATDKYGNWIKLKKHEKEVKFKPESWQG